MRGEVTFVEAENRKDVESILCPLVKEWFFNRFKDFSPTQLYGVKRIYSRQNILISAPTGGTKTLTAFLGIINYLVELSLRNELEDKIYAVYTSPLKALSNDIFFNLEQPLKEIEELAEKKEIKMQKIRVGLRTGDTSVKERAKMARKAPHIFVTTPESLAIVITTKKFAENLAALEFIIVDEIHALSNKRGVFLSLTLERVADLSLIDPVRIGLSATIEPLDEIARFLAGTERNCLIAQVKMIKKIDINLISPSENLLEAESSESQKELYRRLDEIIQQHRTTLIFTNTRNATERIVHYLDHHFPGRYTGLVGAHHSSMSKEKRLEIEEKLRKGELKVVVSSTSLELGLDIGSIDIVVMLKSPKGVARALQRIGRAGHKLHENPKGKFIVLDRDDLVECGVLMKNMIDKKIDRVSIPQNALDVLAQHIFGMAITKIWDEKKMFEVIRKSYCYQDLTREDFMDVISYLAGLYDLQHRYVYAKIWYDEKTKQIGKKGKMARIMYLTNIGTIPEEGFIDVVVQQPVERRGSTIGKIDESFLERMKKGDVFVLGGAKYQFLYAKGMKAYVAANVARNPTIPSWFSEMLPLSFDSAMDIAVFRGLVKERLKEKEKCINFITEYLYCDKNSATKMYNYMKEQADFSEIPDEKTWIIERFKGEKEYLLFHTLYGRKVNDALSRVYGFAAAKMKGRDVEVGINDNGFFIAGENIDENKIMGQVNSKNFEDILKEAIEKTDVLKRRFRHCASRSLMILRNYRGRSKSVGKQQLQSHFLLSATKKISEEFPILREARREVLEDVMDVKNALAVLKDMEKGKIKVKKVNLPLVSPFGLGLLTQSHTDFIKIEEKIAFLKRMHELQMNVIKQKKGIND